MKKIIYIIALFLGILLFNSSKTYNSDNKSPKTRLDSLMCKKWRYDYESLYMIQTYSEKDMVSIENRKHLDKITLSHSFYLTDDIYKMGLTTDSYQKNFDWDKVGKSKNGKYLVTILMKSDGKKCRINWCDIYEIIELTDKKLVLQSVHNTGDPTLLPSRVFKAEPLD